MASQKGWLSLPLLVLVGCAKSTPPPVDVPPPQPTQSAASAPSAATATPAPDTASVEFLTKVAATASRDLPKDLDGETREDTVTAEAGALVYHNTLVNKRASQLNVPIFVRVLKPSIVQNDCTNPSVRSTLLNQGVKLRYTYVDKDGTFVATVDVVQSDCP